MPVQRAAMWFSGVTMLLLPNITIPTRQESYSHPSPSSLIPNASCVLIYSMQGSPCCLHSWFAPAAWLGTSSIAAVVKAGSCSDSSHNSDSPTLLCWTLICQSTSLFVGTCSYSATTLELGLIVTPRQISLHFNSMVLSCALSSTWGSQLIIKQVFNHLNPLET